MRARRYLRISTLGHEHAARIFRGLLWSGYEDKPTLLALARRALATADRSDRGAFSGYVNALENGRRIKVTTAPVVFMEPVPDDLVDEVESVYKEIENDD